MNKKDRKHLKHFASTHGQVYIATRENAHQILDVDAPITAKKVLLGEDVKDMSAWVKAAERMCKPGGIIALIGN